MSWNDSGNGKDPWRRDDNQPADLDKIAKEWQRRFGGIFGGGGGGNAAGNGGGFFLIALLVVAWLFTGFYRVDEAERGVVQRFGAYTKTTMPGLHWHLPFPIEVVDLVNANAVQDFEYRTDMLTADQQYVSINIVVQYRRENVEDYLFRVFNPDDTLEDVTESALREV
ncbi:MAG: protease modulator HflK, partial [Pseudomonadota bacterium]